jgi:hypothetical protein
VERLLTLAVRVMDVECILHTLSNRLIRWMMMMVMMIVLCQQTFVTNEKTYNDDKNKTHYIACSTITDNNSHYNRTITASTQ